LQRVLDGLDSPQPLVKRWALQTLADYHGEPFGRISYWFCSAAQLQALCILYKEWGNALPETSTDSLLRRVCGKLRLIRADRVQLPEPESREAPFDPTYRSRPRLQPELFVERLRACAEKTLAQVAKAINRVGHDYTIADAETRVCDLFAELRWETFETAWYYRHGAYLPAWEPPPEKEPVHTTGTGNWTEKYRRMKAEETALPAVVANGQPTWPELVRLLCNKINESLDEMADGIKNAMLDWDPSGESGTEAPAPQALPSREQFVAAMRPRLDRALHRMAEALYEPDRGEPLGQLIEQLLRDALNEALSQGRNPPPSDSLPLQESLH
jgi:hypothetical protein